MLSYALIFFTAIVLTAFFAGVETGIVRTDPVKLSMARRQKSRQATLLSRLYEKKEEVISMTLIGNNLWVSIASATATSFLFNVFDLEVQGSLLVTLLVTPLILFFGEILPKTYFLENPTGKLLTLSPLIAMCQVIFKPLIAVITLLAKTVVRILPVRSRPAENYDRDDLKVLLELTRTEAEHHRNERIYLTRLLNFNRTLAKSIMKPLVDISILSSTATVSQAVSMISATGYSRIPVYRDRNDNIVGMLHAKDLLAHGSPAIKNSPVPQELIKPAFFAPETRKISELLPEMQTRHSHLTVVIDEYGAPVGILTLEDILEEIFGEIQDEHDREGEEECYPVGKNVFVLSGRFDIDKLNERFQFSLPKHGFETIAGFLLDFTGRIPRPNERIHYKNIIFTIMKTDRRRIIRIRMELNQSL